MFLHVLHQLWMHGVDGHKQCLHRGVIGDASSTDLVTAHTITEYLNTAAEGIEELLLIIHLTILVLLQANIILVFTKLLHHTIDSQVQ